MSESYGAAPFFGFMGVSMALVLASIFINTQTSELLMAQLRQELESLVSLFGSLL